MTVYVAPIVEGQTEQKSLERLLHRAWWEVIQASDRLQVLEPFRGKRDALVHPDGTSLSDCVEKASLKLTAKLRNDPGSSGLLLLLIDAETDCPATLAPGLLTTAGDALPQDVSVACVLPRRMLENWIVAGASSLAGVNGLPDPLPPRDQYEERNGAAWLEAQIRTVNKVRKYKKTVDAEIFIGEMNLLECRNNSPSFDKLCRELSRLSPRPEEREPDSAREVNTDS